MISREDYEKLCNLSKEEDFDFEVYSGEEKVICDDQIQFDIGYVNDFGKKTKVYVVMYKEEASIAFSEMIIAMESKHKAFGYDTSADFIAHMVGKRGTVYHKVSDMVTTLFGIAYSVRKFY